MNPRAWVVGLLLLVPMWPGCVGADATDSDSDSEGLNSGETGTDDNSMSSGGSGPEAAAGGMQVSSNGGSPNGAGGADAMADVCDYPEWQAGKEYQTGDRVIYEGKAYVAEHDNPGYDPVISYYFWEPIDCEVGNSGSGGTNGTGGSGSVTGDCALDRVIGSTEWYSIYSRRRNSFYTYEALCSALERFPDFAHSGNLETDRREAAAFFANVSRETGELEYIEQLAKDPPVYFGRGPLQITHDFNYRAAGEYLGVDLLSNPGLVATDPVLTWEAALWFWMVYEFNGNCHDAIVGNADFGATIRVINGGFECNGPNEAANQRIAYYTDYASRLGVDPGDRVTCW